MNLLEERRFFVGRNFMMLALESEGGHGGFDQTAEQTGFDYLVEEQKTKLESKGYKGDILQEAFSLSLPIYQKRHEMNKTYWSSELQRETEIVTSYEIRYNEERKQYEMYHPEYETYLQDMLARTERYAKEKNQPQVFNKEESDSIIQAERVLISGAATSILYPVWHESGKVRYVVEMTIDGATVKNRYVDVGKIAGRDLSQTEALSFFHTIGNRHDRGDEKQEQPNDSYPMLFLKNDEVGFGEIASTAHDHFNGGKGKIRQESDMGQRSTAEYTENAGYERKSYLWDGNIGEHGLLGTLQIAERLYREKFIPFIQHKREEKKDVGETKKRERRTENVQKDIHAVVARIEKQKEKAGERKRSIIFAQKAGIGIGGALFILDALKAPVIPLTKKEKRELRKAKRRAEQKVSKSDSTKKESTERKDKKPQGNKERNLPARLDLAKRAGEAGRLRKREKRRKRYKEMNPPALRRRSLWRRTTGEAGRLRKRETGNIIFFRKEKKYAIGSKEKRTKEKLFVYGREIGLLAVLEKMNRKIRSERLRTKRKPERKINLLRKEKQDTQERKERVRKTVLEYVRVWVLFSLLKYNFHGRRSLENTGTVVFRKIIVKEEQSCHESSPWILLAIIWYMTMIREQGKAPILPKKKRKKKNHIKKKHHSLKKKFQHLMFRQGVIYAYPY